MGRVDLVPFELAERECQVCRRRLGFGRPATSFGDLHSGLAEIEGDFRPPPHDGDKREVAQRGDMGRIQVNGRGALHPSGQVLLGLIEVVSPKQGYSPVDRD